MQFRIVKKSDQNINLDMYWWQKMFVADTFTQSSCSWKWRDSYTDVKALRLKQLSAPPTQEMVLRPLCLETAPWRWTWPARWARRKNMLCFERCNRITTDISKDVWGNLSLLHDASHDQISYILKNSHKYNQILIL